jgi:hypothetical protein
VAGVEPSATIPILDAGAGLIGLLFSKAIVLSEDQLARLVKRPD